MGTSHIPLKCDRGLGTPWGGNLVPGAFWAGSLDCQRGSGNCVPPLALSCLPFLPSPARLREYSLPVWVRSLTLHCGVSDLKAAALYWVGAPSCIFPYPRGSAATKLFSDPIGGSASLICPPSFCL